MSTASQFQTEGYGSYTTAEAIGPYIRVKLDSSGYVAIAGAGEIGIGITEDYAASGDVVKVRLFTDDGTFCHTAGAAVTKGSPVYAGAAGKCTGVAGNGYLGISRETGVSGDRIEIVQTPAINPFFATFTTGTTAAATDFCFFVATRACKVVAIRQVHAVAAGGTSTLQVTKDTGTTAPGAGTDLLTTAFDLNATANTVQTGSLSATAADTLLAAGDRLSVDFANLIQSSAGVVVTVELVPVP